MSRRLISSIFGTVNSLCSVNLQSQNRRNIMSSAIIKIGTHDGVFHCDEALACWMLKILPEYCKADIVRTRNPDLLANCHTVVDVGAVYDHSKRRYDHHQREFTSTLSSVRPELGDQFHIKLSSAGLVYAHYGESILEQLAKSKNLNLSSENLKIIYKKVYQYFIEEIDAIDNGVPIADTEPKYKITTHLSARVHRINPEWNSKGNIDTDELFGKAMALVGEEFMFNFQYYASTWLPGRELVVDALKNRFEIHKSGEIVAFSNRFPWKEHLFDLEAEMGLSGVIKYVIFIDKPESWRIQAVPITPHSFVLRKPLKKAWRGVRDNVLSEIAGIEGCIFCHTSGFIGGNKTREGALEMAICSLESQAENDN